MTIEDFYKEMEFIRCKLFDLAGHIQSRPADAAFMIGCLYTEVRHMGLKIGEEIKQKKEKSNETV